MVECHPLTPFLPEGTQLLMLGSFPPARARWSMDFFYPNFQNDMWRIFGLIFRDDPLAFVDVERKCFLRSAIIELLVEKKIGIYDTAEQVSRLRDNASDKYLEIVRATDMPALISRCPSLRCICATGGKAAGELAIQLLSAVPPIGEHTTVNLSGRTFDFFRMPSSSRAYPQSLDKKAQAYRRMFHAFGME